MDIKENSDGSYTIPSHQLRDLPHFSSRDEYQRFYYKSINDPEGFWSNISTQFYWKTDAKKVLDYNFDIRKGSVFVKWMDGAQTNICYNILDRQIYKGWGNRIAYNWEGNDGRTKIKITYNELKTKVCKLANALKSLVIKNGDRVAIYMPVSVDCVVAMLASARIGAVHLVMSVGMSSELLAERIIDAKCVLLISCDGCFLEDKLIPIKTYVNQALKICNLRGYRKVMNIVKSHLKVSDQTSIFQWNNHVDISWDDIIKYKSDNCEPVWVNAEDPLFILYTSDCDLESKALVYTIGGYLLQSYLAFKFGYNYRDGDVFFSTNDLASISGHTYSVYGALANCATIVLLEGTPYFPKFIRVWEIIDRLRVNIFNTIPSVLHTLKEMGNHFVKAYNLKSLKLLVITSKPIDFQLWVWCLNVVGGKKCPIFEAYGKTETGGMVISSQSGCPMKPGSVSFPFFGCVPAILDEKGGEIIGQGEGQLVMKKPWPSIPRTIDGDHKLYETIYFEKYPGYFHTGDTVRRDADGYYFIKSKLSSN